MGGSAAAAMRTKSGGGQSHFVSAGEAERRPTGGPPPVQRASPNRLAKGSPQVRPAGVRHRGTDDMAMIADRAASAGPMPDRHIPTRASQALFRAKVLAFQALRFGQDIAHPVARLRRVEAQGFGETVGLSQTLLWSDRRPEERGFQLGKVHNLRRAARALDGLLIPAGGVFSFWKAIGRATRRRGYVPGRMLQEGCLVGAVGGGLCQLSNALYDVAVQAGCEIVERHPHSRVVPGSAAAYGRDATVAWNYVDFRFRAPVALRLEAKLTEDKLVIALHAAGPLPLARLRAPAPEPRIGNPAAGDTANSCATCNETGCFRKEKPAAFTGRTAFVLDEVTPEFAAYVAGRRTAADILAIPLDGARFGKRAYAWDTAGFGALATAATATLLEGLRSRRAARGPGARVGAQLRRAARIAASLARSLTPGVTAIVVSQTLLPFLAGAGHLGGRRVTVLASRLPMSEMHARLDKAAAAHPERATLADFRAPAALVAAEAAGFAAAAEVVTPNTDIAALMFGKATLIPWIRPAAKPAAGEAGAERRIAFPGPAIARKGAAAVRDMARELGLEVVLLGSDLEGPRFWDGITVIRPEPGDRGWLSRVAAVVQPALIEEKPRALLEALAAGVPVIASRACGLPAEPGLALVAADDAAALVRAFGRLRLLAEAA